jgi:uncharacterized membrane protein YfcA
MIDPITACSVFIVTAFMDALHAIYTKAINEEKPALAATAGSFIYVVSAYAVIQYTQNWIYVLFMVAGSWVGTYLTMKYKRKIQKKD